ncbi:MAG: hydrogenase iron-sulfur subunit [Promethearchaeota archaeon]
MTESKDFNPYILGLFCNWCTYAGADQAGTSRMQRPANLRIMRVMCGGRFEPQLILDALMNGADGILASHCHRGDCHYVSGNLKTFGKMALLHLYLKQFGINPKRVCYTQISASEGAELTEVVKEFVQEIKEIGPNPIRKEGN